MKPSTWALVILGSTAYTVGVIWIVLYGLDKLIGKITKNKDRK